MSAVFQCRRPFSYRVGTARAVQPVVGRAKTARPAVRAWQRPVGGPLHHRGRRRAGQSVTISGCRSIRANNPSRPRICGRVGGPRTRQRVVRAGAGRMAGPGRLVLRRTAPWLDRAHGYRIVRPRLIRSRGHSDGPVRQRFFSSFGISFSRRVVGGGAGGTVRGEQHQAARQAGGHRRRRRKSIPVRQAWPAGSPRGRTGSVGAARRPTAARLGPR